MRPFLIFALLITPLTMKLASCNPTPTPVPPTPVAHHASFTWDAPVISGAAPILHAGLPLEAAGLFPRVNLLQLASVESYDVYRAPCLGTIAALPAGALGGSCDNEGTFQSVGTTSETDYSDQSVISGALYSYYVTAVYPGNVESVPSNHVAVTIP